MEKGADRYKGKSLNDIDINPDKDVAEEDSDEERENMVVPAKKVLELIPSEETGTHLFSIKYTTGQHFLPTLKMIAKLSNFQVNVFIVPQI